MNYQGGSSEGSHSGTIMHSNISMASETPVSTSTWTLEEVSSEIFDLRSRIASGMELSEEQEQELRMLVEVEMGMMDREAFNFEVPEQLRLFRDHQQRLGSECPARFEERVEQKQPNRSEDTHDASNCAAGPSTMVTRSGLLR